MIKIRVIPLSNSVKNQYDTIFKVASHSFTNALIQITDLPCDEYELVSSEIFSPGKDVKLMDILLKGPNGYINIEFHKQPLSKPILDRDFEYVVNCYLFYGENIDQKIVVIDDDRKSVEKIEITPNLHYFGDYYYVSDIDGQEVLNIIKNKIKLNQHLSEYELYIFSILPLTKHNCNDKELIRQLCNLTSKLNISDEYKEAISLIQIVLVELFISDYDEKQHLYKVIRMSSTFIENYENELKNQIKREKERADNAELCNNDLEILIKELAQDRDINDANLSKTSFNRLMTILSKI